MRRAGGAEALCALVRARAEERDWTACEALLRALGSVLADSAAAAGTNADVVADALAGLLRGAGRAAVRVDSNSSAGPSSTPSVETPAAATCLACSALTKLAVDDEGGDCIRRRNGVCLLGRLLVDTREAEDEAAMRAGTRTGAGAEGSEASTVGDASPSSAAREVQAHALARRFTFSVERNRRMFKRLFPPSLFAAFIDVGHYKHDMAPYRALARAWRSLGDEEVRAAAAAFEEIDATRGGAARARTVREYALTEFLGQGAFGRVYRAHKARHPETTACAVKELDPSRDAATFGATPEEVSLSVGRMASEVQILKRLEHPNIVNYLDSFREGGMLYIVMELVDGASLLDHITSTAEKGRRMREERVWDIFLQTVLALHYIHSEKGIVHRDLTPNNILLEHDSGRIKIADFGLAKAQPRTSESGREMSTRERRHAETMQSAVGTMPYSCPEIIMHEGYGAKADVWSLGCILYHMLALAPPFRGSNPLAMAQDIVEGRYPSLEPLVRRKSITSHTPNGAGGGGGAEGDVPGMYSAALVGMVDRLLTTDTKRRPSISEVAAACAPRLTRSLDRLRAENDRLRREADRRHERDATEAVTERRRRDAMRRLASRRVTFPAKAPKKSGPKAPRATRRRRRRRRRRFRSLASPKGTASPRRSRPPRRAVSKFHPRGFARWRTPCRRSSRRCTSWCFSTSFRPRAGATRGAPRRSGTNGFSSRARRARGRSRRRRRTCWRALESSFPSPDSSSGTTRRTAPGRKSRTKISRASSRNFSSRTVSTTRPSASAGEV